MINFQGKSISSILNESPFFCELSGAERAVLMEDLLKTYPHLFQQHEYEIEVGYEASWLMQKNF